LASSRIPLPKAEDIQAIPLSIFYFALIALIILIVYGIIGSLYIMRLDPINAIYFTIITIATVGYGDIIPQTAAQKLFAVSLALAGVGLIAYVFSLSISVVTMTVEDITSGSRIRRKMTSMENHFVLCGYGRVGAAVFKELEERNQKAIIIERNRDLVEKELWEDPNVLAIPGDATDESVLKDAGISRARGVIITTGEDVDNLFITLTSREIHPEIWIVARASKRENIKRLYRSGADRVISPETSGGEDIYFAAIEPTMMKITMMHEVGDIRKESEIILKYGCTLEDIEYHLPEFKEPLARKIGISKIEQLNKFLDSLDDDINRKNSLERIYESVSGIHSHWISGPDKETLEKLADELKKEGILLGVNLEPDEIKEVARKYGRLVEVVIKPEMIIVENHGVSDIKEEAEIILKHGCILEDIEYYFTGFGEPLRRKIGLSDMNEVKKFLDNLEKNADKYESLDRIYTLSGGGIHTHRISGPDTKSLNRVENELSKKGFLLGVNMTPEEIKELIEKTGRVVQILVKHEVGTMDDKEIIIGEGGRILDAKHYLPGVRQVVTRNLNIKNRADLDNCEEELEKPDARRSLTALYEISRHIHTHTVAAPEEKIIHNIENKLDKKGVLMGINLSEDEIWEIVEKENVRQFCIE
jgi:voltage-gated potassium channel